LICTYVLFECMRDTLHTENKQGCQILVEFAADGPIGGKNVVTIDGGEYIIERWFYFDEFNWKYIHNFTNKLIRDKRYRSDSINMKAKWCLISKLYENFESKIMSINKEFKNSNELTKLEKYKLNKITYNMCEENFDYINETARSKSISEINNQRLNRNIKFYKRQLKDSFR